MRKLLPLVLLALVSCATGSINPPVPKTFKAEGFTVDVVPGDSKFAVKARIIFSDLIDESTIKTGIILRNETDKVDMNYTYTIKNATTIDLIGNNLEYNKRYRLSVTNKVKSQAGVANSFLRDKLIPETK